MIRLKTNLLVSKSDAIERLQKAGPLALAIAGVLITFLFSPVLAILIAGMLICLQARPSLRLGYSHGDVDSVEICVEFGVRQKTEQAHDSGVVDGKVNSVATSDRNELQFADRV